VICVIDNPVGSTLTITPLHVNEQARWWILVVEKFVGFTEPAMMSSAAATRSTWPQAQQDKTSSDAGDHLPSKAEPSAA
jgi:hypothetical protein